MIITGIIAWCILLLVVVGYALLVNAELVKIKSVISDLIDMQTDRMLGEINTKDMVFDLNEKITALERKSKQ